MRRSSTRRLKNGPESMETRLRYGWERKPMLMLNSYQVVKEAFIDKRHEFAGRFPTKLGALQTQNHDIVFEDYNPTWKALRKVALTAVRKYAMSDSVETLCAEVVDAYVDSLEKGPEYSRLQGSIYVHYIQHRGHIRLRNEV
uniref:Putative cytochrome n=1 Tax=Ixodes ricinus TaxID=34613 RepID=A0A0K8RLX3_IXORI